MKICVASGKGGTGKTTVATSLAASYGEKIQLADCDVETPNAGIFFDDSGRDEENVSLFIPGIDLTKCTGCKECERICRYNALAVVLKSVIVFPELCHSCKGCLYICPENAIYEKEKLIGKITTEKIDNNITLVSGILKTGETSSPRLIDKVQQKLDKETHSIIDSPPGTSCPAVEAMKESDYVILVTEPTPFGLSDLELAVETARLLEKPCGIIVNKNMPEVDIIQKYAQKEGVPILMEIPYSRELAKDYSMGNLVVQTRKELMEEFKTTLENIIRKNEEAAI
ncbi:MAG: (4Fe-4S)-binding protein [Deltaproteobacteria bacterium]|nr:MAG: (4Fe-4S)-binding protein [Deltaproteobacteria bacterium]